MSRHNRRRTRGGYRAAQHGLSLPVIASPSNNHATSNLLGYSSPPLSSYTSNSVLPRGSTSTSKGGLSPTASARHWYSQYAALQQYKQRLSEEEARLIAHKKQIFGPAGDDLSDSESGEDDDLCEKMMLYFEGLDFVQP